MFQISRIQRMILVRPVVWACVVAFGACDTLTGPGSDEANPNVSLAFGVVAEGSPALRAPSSHGSAMTAASTAAAVSPGSLAVDGSNGSLIVDDLRLVLAAFQLRPTEDSCAAVEDEAPCHDFSAPPRFLTLPLDGESELALAEDVPAGSYGALRFRVENLDLSEVASGVTAQDLADLFNEISAEFPDWPAGASMLVSGSFTPAGSAESVPFDVFVDAEIEVVKRFDAPLEVGGGDLTVRFDVDLSRWFLREDGTVRNLAEWDYARTGELLPFHAEIEKGFTDHHVDDGRHEDVETEHFHGPVTGVNPEEGTLTLDGGLVVQVGDRTEIVTGEPGYLSSLAEVAEALESGLDVLAKGSGAVRSMDPLTILAGEMMIALRRAEFEGHVASVNLDAGSFVLVREGKETVVRVTEETEFHGTDLPGRLASLAEVQEALSGGAVVRAHGWGVVESSEPRTIRSVVVTFPLAGEGFEARVASVDLEHGTVTLETGTVVRIADATEIREGDAPGHLAGLGGVAEALAAGGVVAAWGEGFVVGVEPLKIEALWASFQHVVEGFEGTVASVSLETGSFTLESGVEVVLADFTDVIEPDGLNRLANLEEVKAVLDAAGVVSSAGEGFVLGIEPLRVRAKAVGWEEVP